MFALKFPTACHCVQLTEHNHTSTTTECCTCTKVEVVGAKVMTAVAVGYANYQRFLSVFVRVVETTTETTTTTTTFSPDDPTKRHTHA